MIYHVKFTIIEILPFSLVFYNQQVNPITKKETKAISDYKKVPLLIADGVELRESSVITSILHTHMTSGTPISEVKEWYPNVNMGNEDTNKGERLIYRRN